MAKRKPELAFPVVIETFRRPGMYEQQNLTSTKPTVFNDVVSVRRYRITIEEISEPNEVIAARLQELWDTTDNHHNWTPIRHIADEIGYTLIGGPGSKRIKR
jgi:hypothetical protein